MKKYFELPEVELIELAESDLILMSAGLRGMNFEGQEDIF